ncbi:MAG: TIGR01777 family oxidoreductase [Thermoanaerobaculia bacterium]|nr:TIGR01777 family oxidoreductase [Thermoanaerobaculia bacterium]
MRILVTGGTGLIGSRLVEILAADGNDVAVLTRSPDREHGLPPAVAEVGWDAESLGDWVTELPRTDVVVHLAGENISSGRWTEERKRAIRRSRVDSTRVLARAFAECDPRPEVLVQASGIDYYGARGDEIVTEETSAGDGFLAGVCQEWEEAGRPVEALGVRRPRLRTGLVLSGRGGALPLMKRPFQLFVGGPLGSGEQYVSWIHLEDEVRAIRHLIEEDEADGPFNLTAPHPVTNEELSARLADALGRPNLFRVPAPVLRILLGEMAELLLTGQRAVPRRLEELGFEFRYPDLGRALEEAL